MNKLANNLKKLMQGQDNISESELARQTGIGQPVINRLINGITTNPNIATLAPLAAYFSVSVDELISSPIYVKSSATPQGVPLISWQQATDQPLREHLLNSKKKIMTTKGITENSFSLIVPEDIDIRFPKGTTLIIETEKKIKHRDFVIVQHGKQSTATLKHYIVEGEEHYLKSLDPALGAEKFTADFRLIGVVVQSIFDFH